MTTKSMNSPGEVAAGVAAELFLLVIVLAVLYRVWGWFFAVPRRQLVTAFQRGVLLRAGQVEKVLGPGSYWITPKRTLLLCDVRPTPFQVAAQELLSRDGIRVRVSLGGEYQVVNPAFFVTESSDAFATFYLEMRQALRAAAAELISENILAGRSLLGDRVKELLVPRAAQLGIKITRLEAWEAISIA